MSDKQYGIFAVKEWLENGKKKRKVVNGTVISQEEYQNLKLSGDQPDNTLRTPEGPEIKYRAFAFAGSLDSPKVDVTSMIRISLKYFISNTTTQASD